MRSSNFLLVDDNVVAVAPSLDALTYVAHEHMRRGRRLRIQLTDGSHLAFDYTTGDWGPEGAGTASASAPTLQPALHRSF